MRVTISHLIITAFQIKNDIVGTLVHFENWKKKNNSTIYFELEALWSSMFILHFSISKNTNIIWCSSIWDISQYVVPEIYNIKKNIRSGFMYFTVEVYLLRTFSCVWYKKLVEKRLYKELAFKKIFGLESRVEIGDSGEIQTRKRYFLESRKAVFKDCAWLCLQDLSYYIIHLVKIELYMNKVASINACL